MAIIMGEVGSAMVMILRDLGIVFGTGISLSRTYSSNCRNLVLSCVQNMRTSCIGLVSCGTAKAEATPSPQRSSFKAQQSG